MRRWSVILKSPQHPKLTTTYDNTTMNIRYQNFIRVLHFVYDNFGFNPDFSRARAVQEQGISARRRSVLLRGLNNAVHVPLWLAFGEEHQIPFFYFTL